MCASSSTNLLKLAGQTVYFQSAEKMSMIPDNSVTLVITSPPYWNVRDYGGEQIGFGQSYQDYIASLNRVWSECLRILQPNGKICINVQPLPISSSLSGFNFRIIKNIMHDIEAFFRSHNCFLSGMHYWDKSAYINTVSWGSYPRPTNIASNTSFEQIFTFVTAGKTRNVSKELMDQSLLTKEEWRHWAVRCIWDDISPVIKINPKGENLFGHSAPFPEDIPYRLIKMHTIVGETVVDPFLGSGTTLKMTRLLNRHGIGFELNEQYRNLIKERIMESWTPPSIESGYKTLGFDSLITILYDTIQIAKNSQKDKTEKQLLEESIKKMYEKRILTSHQRKKILKLIQNSKFDT
ncbi:MAG: site-specific DNA-methyltransferase [Candidatus Lokiarchaeota archaeon]|nr:site-specific DNA-methyltransferase [Candidatus Harpocratesius repetitus]